MRKVIVAMAAAIAIASGQGRAAGDGHPELSAGDEAYSAENYAKAAGLYRQDAELGVTAAQLSLAIMYLDGQGVAQDFQQAAKWFEKATEFGNAEAQHNLGQLYQEGKGVPKDLVAADKWFRLAGAGGSAAKVEKDMTPEQIAQAAKLAEEWRANFNKAKGR
jgi:TPR repeat protein